jgi:peptide chain release factor 1
MRLTKKDFRVETFTCGGNGGQHQNRSRSCVRITHIETGISAESRLGRSLEQNKKDAFIKLGEKLKHWILQQENDREEVSINTERIRTYNEKSNTVQNTGGTISLRYDEVMSGGGGIGPLVEERRKKFLGQ